MLLAEWFLGTGPGDINAGNALFFLSLLSLLTTLHDHYQPVHAYRARHRAAARVTTEPLRGQNPIGSPA